MIHDRTFIGDGNAFEVVDMAYQMGFDPIRPEQIPIILRILVGMPYKGTHLLFLVCDQLALREPFRLQQFPVALDRISPGPQVDQRVDNSRGEKSAHSGTRTRVAVGFFDVRT